MITSLPSLTPQKKNTVPPPLGSLDCYPHQDATNCPCWGSVREAQVKRQILDPHPAVVRSPLLHSCNVSGDHMQSTLARVVSPKAQWKAWTPSSRNVHGDTELYLYIVPMSISQFWNCTTFMQDATFGGISMKDTWGHSLLSLQLPVNL